MSKRPDEDFAQAVDTILSSRLWAIVDGAARTWRASVSDSRFVAAAARGWHAFEALPQQDRLRAMAIAAAVAAASHALLLGLVPPALRPAVPRAFWMVLSAAAAVAAVRKSGGKNQASDA